MRTISSRLLLPGGVLAALLLLTLAAAPVAAQGDCSLTVTPRSGPPGTQFVFTGTGFTSTSMTLTRQGEPPRTLDLTADTDPFTVKLIGGEGDAGKWHAVAEGCSKGTTFRVTLPPTATSLNAGSGSTEDRSPVIAAFGLLAMLFLGVTTFLLPRVARSIRAR